MLTTPAPEGALLSDSSSEGFLENSGVPLKAIVEGMEIEVIKELGKELVIEDNHEARKETGGCNSEPGKEKVEIIQICSDDFFNGVKFKRQEEESSPWGVSIYLSMVKAIKEQQWQFLEQERIKWAKMGMYEIRGEGYHFSSGNNRVEEGFVEERLDRAFCSFEWWDQYPNASSLNIIRTISDHSFLLLNIGEGKEKKNIRDSRLIKDG
ncbi:retrotransposon protein [Striga asiatica]|uniref:Retrotransposon protein n=1 Tax=Striga asiatica TaxID=4170 RepID=A0A5A7PA71_STRAF|nr:retrotransposon protein [Striga asiatica]